MLLGLKLFRSLHLDLILICLSMLSVSLAQDKSPTTAPDATDVKPEQPPNRSLDANLYMQTSAEYRAACYQAYNWAAVRVEQKLKERTTTDKPPCVIFDLDETVLDNYNFQTEQIRKGYAFDPKRWETWEQTGADKIGVIPGAVEFITKLKEIGVERFYITNRNDKARVQTMSALRRHGIDVPEDQLLCADEKTGSNKTSRREQAHAKFDVLLIVGDNLRDFDDAFRYDKTTGIDGRRQTVDNTKSKFGFEWIILPNPAYGEWTRAFSNSENDKNLLLPPPEKN
jgi:5'-nucleotidase (lipoprotein e(P4) family)